MRLDQGKAAGALEPGLGILKQIRRGQLQRCAELEHHAQAWTVAPKLDEGDVIAVGAGLRSERLLAPFFLQALGSQGLPEGFIR